MTTELWMPIVGYKGLYEVSSEGNVRSIGGRAYRKESRILKPFSDTHKYLKVKLSIGDVPNTVKVHRLVAIAFIPNPDNKATVNHKNGIRNDNRVDNLEWHTMSENVNHSFSVLGKKISRDLILKGAKANSKKVLHIPTNIVYDSISDAKRQLSISMYKIKNSCLGITTRESKICDFVFENN